jgi:hypothetical protein
VMMHVIGNILQKKHLDAKNKPVSFNAYNYLYLHQTR